MDNIYFLLYYEGMKDSEKYRYLILISENKEFVDNMVDIMIGCVIRGRNFFFYILNEIVFLNR